MISRHWFVAATLLASLLPSEGNEFLRAGAPLLVCVKKGNTWALKAVSEKKAEGMIQTGDAAYPGSNGLSVLCHLEKDLHDLLVSRQGSRREQEAVCQRSGDGFAVVSTMMAPPREEDEQLMSAPKKNDEQQDGTVEMLPGMTLWEWAVSETPWPVCDTPGQNEAFQGRDLFNNAGVCDKINICHGNAGFGWNRITVSRESLGEPTAADASGHAEEEHNKMHNKRADYFPMTESVPNPNGAGINGYLDDTCGFVCPDCPVTTAPTTAPTALNAPTQSPTTDAPTYNPTEVPTTVAPTTATPTTLAPTIETFPVGSTVDVDGTTSCTLQSDCTCEDPEDVGAPSGTHGDPHFVMFNGRHFEFHGGCDLVLLSAPDYNNGQGLKVHIRTKIDTFFSYVERVAVQIGEDVLEVKGGFLDGQFWHNGNMLPQKELTKEDGLLPFTVGDNKVFFETQRSSISWKVTIVLPEGQTLSLRTNKDFMRVDIEGPKNEYFGSAKGLMGTFEDDDQMLSRDGNIVFEDPKEYGHEWQVRDTEPMLFKKAAGPQYPQQCQMPSSWWVSSVKRRLAASSVTYEDAERACAHLHPSERGDCIYDVVATGDLEIASAY